MKKRKKYNKIVSFLLLAVMIISIVTIATPQQVKAAGDKKFKGKGTSTVTITDDECLKPIGYKDYVTQNYNYIKFKPGVTGYITIKITSNSNFDPSWCYGSIKFGENEINHSKGISSSFYALSNHRPFHPYEYTRTYGVRKGKTYYFKVQSYGGIKIKATVTAVKKGTNNSRAKAKTLEKNATVKGIILTDENKVDWYKIKVTEKQKIKLIYNTKTSGFPNHTISPKEHDGIKITFCKSNGKPFSSDNNNYILAEPGKSSGTSVISGKQTYIRPGIYYIKVERNNEVSSGYYTLKWN